MLDLQSMGTSGLIQMVNDVVDGGLSNSTQTALIQAVSISFSISLEKNIEYYVLLIKQFSNSARTIGIVPSYLG